MTCSDSHHICNRCAFLALMMIITIYCHIRISAALRTIYEYTEAQNSKKLRILRLSKKLSILIKKGGLHLSQIKLNKSCTALFLDMMSIF